MTEPRPLLAAAGKRLGLYLASNCSCLPGAEGYGAMGEPCCPLYCTCGCPHPSPAPEQTHRALAVHCVAAHLATPDGPWVGAEGSGWAGEVGGEGVQTRGCFKNLKWTLTGCTAPPDQAHLSPVGPSGPSCSLPPSLPAWDGRERMPRCQGAGRGAQREKEQEPRAAGR